MKHINGENIHNETRNDNIINKLNNFFEMKFLLKISMGNANSINRPMWPDSSPKPLDLTNNSFIIPGRYFSIPSNLPGISIKKLGKKFTVKNS